MVLTHFSPQAFLERSSTTRRKRKEKAVTGKVFTNTQTGSFNSREFLGGRDSPGLERKATPALSLQSSLAAAAAAKSLQSCPTPCDPIDGSPPGSPIPGILQARTLEWVAISFSNA